MADKMIIRSACRMCHGGCGVLVHIDDGRVVNIKGDPDSPLNQGRMCPKGLASIEHLYHPDRLKFPLKRAGSRGEGKWQRITWEQALETIVSKIQSISEKYGTEAIAIAQGTGRHHFHHVLRFANVLGTPNWCEPGTAQCFIPRVLAGVMTYGGLPVCDYYGEVNPQCLLVWGHNPVISGPDGEIQFRVKDCMKKGTRLIVVDPRRNEIAAKADLWLQIRPGTDAALAMSMMNVIINESQYDKDFVDKWSVGFDALAERVGPCTPQWAESITWIPANQIREAAMMYAQTKPAALEWGVALEHTPNCFQTVRAVAILPGITGNIDVPGGSILGMNIMPDAPILSETLSDEMKNKRMGAEQYKILCGRNSLFPSAHIPTLLNAMRTGNPYPVKGFLLFGNNGLLGFADSRRVYESMMKLDFILSMDLYMTPTAELADIVLPAASWLELDEMAPLPIGAPHVVLVQQKAVRLWECRSDEEVLVDLARRLNLACGTESVEEIYNLQLASAGMVYPEFKGLTFDDLRERGYISVPIKYRKYEQGGFMTISGKAEFSAGLVAAEGYDPLPSYSEPPESPASSPELIKNYPYVLTTGGRSMYFFHSEFRQIPSLRKKHQNPIVEIHPETAKSNGVVDGDWVWIESPRDRIRQIVKITDGIDPRVVNVQHGWWYPEKTSPDHGVWESNANVLTSMDPPYDPAMGTYQFRALLCRISKC